MTRGQITKTVLEQKLPAVLREQMELDGFDDNHLPSWEYITAHTRWSAQGLHNKTEEVYGKSLHEFLRSKGFGTYSETEFPTDDEHTIMLLKEFFGKVSDRMDWSENTINPYKSAIPKAYEAIEARDLDTDLADLGYYDSEYEKAEKNDTMNTILDWMNDRLSTGTMLNYVNVLDTFYARMTDKPISPNYPVLTHNPVEVVREDYKFVRPKGDPTPLTKEQIRDLWTTLDNLDDSLVEGYSRDEWVMWMKMLIVFLIAVGPRADEVERVNLPEQLHFRHNPICRFRIRKNSRDESSPVNVPIMMGVAFLKAYVAYIEETGKNGKIVPSPESESGSRVADTLNEWIKRLAREADVRLSDGSLPTLQNFRQFWKENYVDAVFSHREIIQFVSEEDGKKSAKSDELDYLREMKNKKRVRELGRKHFEDILDLEELPNEMQNSIDQNEYLDRQSGILDYTQ